jgi:NADH-quinone oxidoreductase subunit F
MAEYIHHLFEFSTEESCGKCFPGRLGSYRGKEMFDQAKKGTAKIPLLQCKKAVYVLFAERSLLQL